MCYERRPDEILCLETNDFDLLLDSHAEYEALFGLPYITVLKQEVDDEAVIEKRLREEDEDLEDEKDVAVAVPQKMNAGEV